MRLEYQGGSGAGGRRSSGYLSLLIRVRRRCCDDELAGVDVQRGGHLLEPGQRGRGPARHHFPEMRAAHAGAIGEVGHGDLALLGDLSDPVHDALMKIVHASARYGQSAVAESGMPEYKGVAFEK